MIIDLPLNAAGLNLDFFNSIAARDLMAFEVNRLNTDDALAQFDDGGCYTFLGVDFFESAADDASVMTVGATVYESEGDLLQNPPDCGVVQLCPFRDDFARPDSNTVGNGWIEFESEQQGGDPDDNASIVDERLRLQDDQFNIIPIFEQETKVVQEGINVSGYTGLFIRFDWASLSESDNDLFIVEWRPCGGDDGDWVIGDTLNIPDLAPNVFVTETADISAADGEDCIDIRLRTQTSQQEEGVLLEYIEVCGEDFGQIPVQ
ncbi:MAG: hypothetical protein R3E58_07635 [Phycisphaerae bacterium]